jgi:hypothetical protein
MATFEIPLYETAEQELVDLHNRRPHWVERLFMSRGADLADPAPSAEVEALGEGLGHRLASLALVLRKVEARGWTVELRGNDVRVATGLQTESARRAMEDDGIWHIVQLLVGRRGADLFTYR